MKIMYSKKSLKFLIKHDLAVEMLRRIVLAWDPDYTKLTPREKAELREAENSGYVDADEINWDDLEKYA